MGDVGQKRILVADDRLAMRIMLQDVLSEAGFDVTTAADGKEAWSILQEEADKIDLMILDLLMPRMNGFEILEKLPWLPGGSRKKVLVITGVFKSDHEIHRLKRLGAAGYIFKTGLVDKILYRVNQMFYLGGETRKHPRLIISLPIDYNLRQERLSGYTSNLSAGGAFIRTIDPAPLDEPLEVDFVVPELNLSVKAKGRVVWNHEYDSKRKKSSLPGMGIEFIYLDPSVKNNLADFLDQKLQNEPIWLST
jgi:uncharacterized protein (TIGR02266 family)